MFLTLDGKDLEQALGHRRRIHRCALPALSPAWHFMYSPSASKGAFDLAPQDQDHVCLAQVYEISPGVLELQLKGLKYYGTVSSALDAFCVLLARLLWGSFDKKK